MISKLFSKPKTEQFAVKDKITLASGMTWFTEGGNDPIVKTGNIVQISTAFKNANVIASGSTAVLGTINDASLRPKVYTGILMQASGNNIFFLVVRPNGTIELQRHRLGQNNSDVSVNAWLNCQVTYITG